MINTTFCVVKATLIETLGLHGREATITEQTLLLGSMRELDSLTLVQLITALEDRFRFEMDGADINGEVFESVGSLVVYLDAQFG